MTKHNFYKLSVPYSAGILKQILRLQPLVDANQLTTLILSLSDVTLEQEEASFLFTSTIRGRLGGIVSRKM